MDDIVKAALLKWPDVPSCYGWLGLDARGDWYLRDEPTQAAGRFPQAKGSRIEHQKLREFIARNYASTAGGAWFFQNGPQQVFVALEAAPWILGVHHTEAGWAVHSHTDEAWPEIEAAWLDETGRLYLTAPQGLGLVRSMDMAAAAQAVEAGLWQPQDIQFADLIQRHGVQLDPQF